MKNYLLLLLLISNLSFGQSITILPSGPNNTLIQKEGEARLSIIGTPNSSVSGKSILTLDSNPFTIGAANASSSTIEFNNNLVNKFSIKHNNYGSYNSSFVFQNFSWLSFNNGNNEIARLESDYMNIKKLGIGSPTYTGYPLTFNSAFGDKISLSDKLCISSFGGSCFFFNENHFGIGYQSNLFQIFTRSVDGDIVFGYGKSSDLTEKVRFKGSGNVGIGVSNPLAKLHVDGDIRTSSLAGTGLRNVKADANGILTTSATTKYLSIPCTSFIKISNDGTAASYFFGLAYLNSGTGQLKCSLNLPHNAVITNIRAYFMDKDITNNLTFYLERTPHTGFASILTPYTTSSGSSNNVQFMDLSGLPLTVDNLTNNYKIALSQETGGVWSTQIGVSSVVITYEE
jgi:hypothetical protein